MHAQQLHDAGVIALLEQGQARLAARIGLRQGVTVRRGQKAQRCPEHTAASSQAVMERAAVVLPAKDTGTGVFTGLWKDAPPPCANAWLWWCSRTARQGWDSRRLANSSNGWPSKALPAWLRIRLPCLTG